MYKRKVFKVLAFTLVFLLIISSGVFMPIGSITSKAANFEVRNLIPYVDPRIGANGTDGTGKCSMGATMPFGSILVCPHTPNSPSTGYKPTEKITGFTNVNTGMVNKYVNLLISPQTGLDCVDNQGNSTTNHDSAKANEIVQPGYYSVDLTKFGIKTEITTAGKAAIYRLTYPATSNGDASIMVNPSQQIFGSGGNATVAYDTGSNIISGYLDSSNGWYYSSPRVYYAIKFSKAVVGYGTFTNNGNIINANSTSAAGTGIGCYLKFNTAANEKVYLKVAISFKSTDNAKSFLDSEIPAWDFDGVKTANQNSWNQSLSSILIDDAAVSNDELKIFYTALYHTMVGPKNKTGDCPWDYTGPYYDDQFCVWDTFRSEFPLLTLIKESVVRDTIQSYSEIYKHYGYAYDAFIGGQGDMIQGGDDVDVLIADAYLKGVQGINWTDAYNLLKGHATNSGRTSYYRENDRGWVPYDTIPIMAYATASKTMEFAYNDFCIAKVAEGLGYTSDKDRFGLRSQNWSNLWNSTISSNGFTGFIESKNLDGSWVNIDPTTNPDGSFSKHFYEGNSWTYSFYTPHQMSRNISFMGGNSTFINRLAYYENNLNENGNEPCFLAPYLFIYASRPDLASYYVRQLWPNYTTTGYLGDDDSGAMSSWYVFSKLGIFPVAGQDLYLINGPRFQKVTIQMESGNNIVINGTNASAANTYVQSAALNGSALNQAWITHTSIKNGATLNFTMGPNASSWATSGAVPPSYNFSTAAPADRTESGNAFDGAVTNPPNEDETKAFDNSVQSKWLVFSQTGNIGYDFSGTQAYPVNRYTVASGNDEPGRNPRCWVFEGSNNGTSWTALDTRSNVNFSELRQVKEFSFTNTTTYQQYRLRITGNNGAPYLQLSEIQMYYDSSTNPVPVFTTAPRSNAAASSTSSGWPASNAIDGNLSTAFSGAMRSGSAATDWISFDMGQNYSISRVRLYPRVANNLVLGFPVDFKIQYSNDNTTWYDVPGQSYSNFVKPGASELIFNFNSKIIARYMRLYATKLGTDDFNNYFMQLAEFNADYVDNSLGGTFTAAPRTNITSRTVSSGWEPAKAIDGSNSTAFSSAPYFSAGYNDWLTLDMGQNYNIKRIRLYPRTVNNIVYGFPLDFKFQYSNDGVLWNDVPEQHYAKYAKPGNYEQKFTFNSPVNARYIRLYTYKLGTDDYNNVYFQMAEFNADY